MRRENLFSGIYPREKYLARIRPFYDSDIVKVITGIRRCGKSFILRSVMNEIAANGIPASRIIYLPLEQRGYKGIRTPEDLEELIAARLSDDVAHYLLLDEIQNVRGFESVVAAYAAGLPWDCLHGAATVAFLALIWDPWCRQLKRVLAKYALG